MEGSVEVVEVVEVVEMGAVDVEARRMACGVWEGVVGHLVCVEVVVDVRGVEDWRMRYARHDTLRFCDVTVDRNGVLALSSPVASGDVRRDCMLNGDWDGELVLVLAWSQRMFKIDCRHVPYNIVAMTFRAPLFPPLMVRVVVIQTRIAEHHDIY